MAETIQLIINGKHYEAMKGQTILQAAKMNGIYIPSLCYLEGVHQYGSCRVCMVEVQGFRTLVAACMVEAKDGMVIRTNSARVRHARKMNIELILSEHPQSCLSCGRNGSCELQKLVAEQGIDHAHFKGSLRTAEMEIGLSITRDTSKCILCRRCVTICNEIQKVGVLNAQNRGFKTFIGPAIGKHVSDVDCTNCGQCTLVCPVDALSETSSIDKVWDALGNPDKHVVVQTAPAVRVSIGEEFGLPAGTPVTGKLASALRQLEFDEVFDTNFGADLTIMEEGSEFLSRAKAVLTGGHAALPLITSCSPGWVKFLEHRYAGLIPNLSTCKSPHMMEGAIIKSYYAEKAGIHPEDIFVVSIMPCTAKKFEIARPEMMNGGLPNVDAVLTVRELAKMLREAGIDFANLPDGEYDSPMGNGTGAADIFGVTGGVMEAALRTVYELVTGRELPFEKLRVLPIEGNRMIKKASLTFENVLPEYAFLEGFTANVAVTSGFEGAGILMDEIASGKADYHFVEVMGCPGGCIVGGGQPRNYTLSKWHDRAQGIYHEDERKPLRKSHENPQVKQLYAEFLGTPLSHVSHELLHTTYTDRSSIR
ncbi:MAG TPA: iron hydrogenase small subunit [Candidatus Aphodomonas merdavium]|nr:iron hydrogenase small subunit [Candidatus Aphodomonas merdavium]